MGKPQLSRNFIVHFLAGGSIVLARLLPHLANATPLIPLTLLFGTKRKYPWSIILGMLASDYILGFDTTAIVIYPFIFLTSYLPRLMGTSMLGITASSVISSLTFYFISNAAVWIFTSLYPYSISGLMQCLYMGIPFLKNHLLSDIIATICLVKGSEFYTAPARARTPMLVTTENKK